MFLKRRYVSTHRLVLPIIEIEVINLLLNEENLFYCEVCPFLPTVLKDDSNYLFSIIRADDAHLFNHHEKYITI